MSTTEELIRKSQAGDPQAKEQLIQDNTGLIWSVTKRYIGRGADQDDLFQLGCLGFLKAVDGFDLTYGTQFSTYAVPKIAGEIRRFLRDDGAIKVSRSVKERASAIKLAKNQLAIELDREPTLTELAEKTGYAADEIAMALSATAEVGSIQQETGTEGFTLEQILSDNQSEERLLEHIALKQAVAELPDREKMVIGMRYFHGLTQQKVANILCVSQVQVSRIEKKALEALRDIMG